MSSCWTTDPKFNDQGGSRTHTTQVLGLAALPIGLLGRSDFVLTPIPHPYPSVADLGVEPSIQAYETQSGAGPSANT